MFRILAKTRRPDITFHKSGRIDIASYIARLLNIQKGDVIDIAVTDGEYYLFVPTHCGCGRHEGVCFPSNNRAKKTNSFRAHSTRLCRSILAVAGSNEKACLPCGELCELSIGKAVPIIVKNDLKR